MSKKDLGEIQSCITCGGAGFVDKPPVSASTYRRALRDKKSAETQYTFRKWFYGFTITAGAVALLVAVIMGISYLVSADNSSEKVCWDMEASVEKCECLEIEIGSQTSQKCWRDLAFQRFGENGRHNNSAR